MDIEEAKKYCKQIKDKDLWKIGYVYGREAIETVLSELEKKEKQIDLMAKEIYECNEYIDNEFERELKFKSVEDVKQYFTM